jgi:sugar lactone lactonase YvrE
MLNRLMTPAQKRLARRRAPRPDWRTVWQPFFSSVGSMALVVLLALAGLSIDSAQGNSAQAAQPEKAKAPAPAVNEKEPAKERDPFDGGIAWLNTDKPIKLADLKGRIVLLDFWTLCCINCIHVMPDLAKLEAKYPGILVVIGVHTPKFPNEAFTGSIQKAILRYEIKHPVVNDAKMAIWRRFGVNSWPTVVLIDPEGNAYGKRSGEGVYDVLDHHIGKMAKAYRDKKMLVETPIEFKLAAEKRGPLFFPGKILADAAGKRLFIADSTNHRVVITDLDGKKIAIAGTGAEGSKDGGFDKAQFSDPQGMTLHEDTLYVADRKNHQIRALDLKKQTVKTVAGIGEQDRTGRNKGGPALKTGLNSPWDLLYQDGKIFIAMAGHHQIWTYNLKTQRVDPFAGNGAEDIVDGELGASSYAQPSGLATDGKTLWIADSEASAIRAIPIDGKGESKTVVGVTGDGLFNFGDKDGVADKARLQHALGVAYRDGKLYVADTYNSKLKLIDPKTQACTTFKGEGGGWLESPTFNEPAGLSFAGDKLYVADTNAHRIRVVDMKSRAVTTLRLEGVEAPKVAKSAKSTK